MIPLKDINPTKTFPYVTILLIVLNVYIFLFQTTLDWTEIFYFRFGLIPECFLTQFDDEKYQQSLDKAKAVLEKSLILTARRRGLIPIPVPELKRMEIFTIFSSMFLHGGLAHLLGNMWFLWIFGNNIEDSSGHLKFFLFYIVCGIAASFLHIGVNTTSIAPSIGASGAISGVLGAYLLLYPRARILTFIPIGYFLWLEELPAYIFLGYWIFLQFIFGLLRGGNVAWFAHIGGFIAGLALIVLFKKRTVPLFK